MVGCAGSFPGPDSPASCYLLEHDDTRILLDLGNGSLGALQKYIDIYQVDAVLISHLHVDHFIDLCSYYVALKYRPGGPADPVVVYGPTDTGRRIVDAYGMRNGESVAAEFNVRDHEPNYRVGPFTISTARMVHPVEAYGFRVEAGGQTIVYSGDTGPTDRLVDLAHDADLALFEASFLENSANPSDLHLTSRQAADLAKRAGVGELVLTHLVPWHDPAESLRQATGHFDGPIRLAEPGLRIDLSS